MGQLELGMHFARVIQSRKSQSLGTPNRPRDLGDFDCGSFLAVSQITKTV